MSPLDPDWFVAFRKDLEAHPRLCGYYIVKLVEIGDLRTRGCTEEEIAEAIFQHFDDHMWPPSGKRPKDQTWADCRTDRASARGQVVECLMGGPAIGHLEVTIPNQECGTLFDRFDSMFGQPKTYYVGLGLGDPEHVFSGGVVIIASDLAGCLWVVESD